MNICFLTKREKPFVDKAIDFTNEFVSGVDIYDGSLSNSFPNEIINKEYDIIISYISNWIVPLSILEKTKKWNINFHPGPPEYPGIGCFNFAIYDSAKEYGVTSHIMNPNVDTGEIIGVERFNISNDENVKSLSAKTYQSLFHLYKEVIGFIMSTGKLPNTNEIWKRKPFKRTELEELATIKLNMSKDEINRRIRATYLEGKPAPFIEVAGHRFEYNPER